MTSAGSSSRSSLVMRTQPFSAPGVAGLASSAPWPGHASSRIASRSETLLGIGVPVRTSLRWASSARSSAPRPCSPPAPRLARWASSKTTSTRCPLRPSVHRGPSAGLGRPLVVVHQHLGRSPRRRRRQLHGRPGARREAVRGLGLPCLVGALGPDHQHAVDQAAFALSAAYTAYVMVVLPLPGTEKLPPPSALTSRVTAERCAGSRVRLKPPPAISARTSSTSASVGSLEPEQPAGTPRAARRHGRSRRRPSRSTPTASDPPARAGARTSDRRCAWGTGTASRSPSAGSAPACRISSCSMARRLGTGASAGSSTIRRSPDRRTLPGEGAPAAVAASLTCWPGRPPWRRPCRW